MERDRTIRREVMKETEMEMNREKYSKKGSPFSNFR